MNAELAARRIAAAAVLADFKNAVFSSSSAWPTPMWSFWAGRLACAVDLLLEVTAGQEMSCDDKDSVKRDNLHEA